MVESLRPRGIRLGMLELQTLWPFPYEMVKEKCKNARHIVVVEMNVGQMIRMVKRAVDAPDRVVLANRIDGLFISDKDIKDILRVIQGKGV